MGTDCCVQRVEEEKLQPRERALLYPLASRVVRWRGRWAAQLAAGAACGERRSTPEEGSIRTWLLGSWKLWKCSL